MNRWTLLAAAACLAASPAVFAKSDFKGCPKPFTAKAHGGGSDEVWDFACQGMFVRASRPGGQHTMLTDLAKGGKTYILFDATREYYEHTPDRDEEEERVEHEACSEHRKLVKDHPGLTCRKTGAAVVGGRKTDRYETRGEGLDEPIVEFYDPELQVIVKEQKGSRTTSELRDIKVGSVSGSFRVPAGYRKLSEQEYMARMMKEVEKQQAQQQRRK